MTLKALSHWTRENTLTVRWGEGSREGADGVPYLGFVEEPTLEQARRSLTIPGSTGTLPESATIAAWNGHEFEVVEVDLYVRSTVVSAFKAAPHEYSLLAYFPIDPRIIEADVARATVAYPNEDNTGWLFAHCDQDWMFDHEMRLRAAAESVFGGSHRNSFLGVNIGMRLLLNNDTQENRAAADRSRAHAQILDTFHADVVKLILHEARSRHLGYFQQNPHEGHVLAPIERAIRLVVSRWDSTPEGVANHKLIRKAVARALNTVQHRHGYETRWDQAARLEAERKAAEEAAAGDDGSGE